MIKKLAIPWQVRIHLFLFAASLLWIIVPAINKVPSELVTRHSLVAASEFLYLVDTEEYAKSWEVTSAALKSMLTQAAWSRHWRSPLTSTTVTAWMAAIPTAMPASISSKRRRTTW